MPQYAGVGYGIPTEGVMEAMHMTAQTEGIILDPTYTGKAMAALIDRSRDGKVPKDRTVVFMHTGGLPQVFAFNDMINEWNG